MYLDLQVDAKDFTVTLPDAIDVSDFDVGLCYLAIPKSFDMNIRLMSLHADIVSQQIKGERIFYSFAVDDSHKGAHLIIEPMHIQYRGLDVENIRTIMFALRDSKGQNVAFKSGKILLTLNLRRKLTWKTPNQYR